MTALSTLLTAESDPISVVADLLASDISARFAKSEAVTYQLQWPTIANDYPLETLIAAQGARNAL